MEMSETFGFSNFCNSEIHKVKSSADKEDFKGLTFHIHVAALRITCKKKNNSRVDG